MGLDVFAYARQILGLLPPGDGLLRDADSEVFDLALSLGEEPARVSGRADDLIREADPSTTLELLPEWEAMLGLPETCTTEAQSIEERRLAVVAKLTTVGAQTPAFYIALAASVGYVVTITEYRPFRSGWSHSGDLLTDADWAHTWTVNAPETSVREFQAGKSVAGEALRTWSNQILECTLSARKPAHTVLLFAYA